MSRQKSRRGPQRRDKPGPSETSAEGQAVVPDDRSVLEIAAEWVNRNVLWALGLTPFAVAALQMLIVARGDTATLRVLVQNADPVKVILGGVMPVIPVGLLILVPYHIERRIRRESIPKWWFWASLGITGLGVFAMPSAWFSMLTFACAMLIFVAYEWYLRRRGKATVRVYQPTAWLITMGVFFAGAAGPWMSAELVETRNNGPIVAYVLGNADGWTTLLRYGGGVDIIPSDDLQKRTVCNVRIEGRSAIGRVLGWPAGNPLCSEAERDAKARPRGEAASSAP